MGDRLLICPPYLLTKEEFEYFSELYRPDGASQHKYTGRNSTLEKHLEVLGWLSFGVPQWLHQKAMGGDQEALFKIQYSYNLYQEVLCKAKEEKLI